MSRFRADLDRINEATWLLSAANPGFNEVMGGLRDLNGEIDVDWKGLSSQELKNKIDVIIQGVNEIQGLVKEVEKYSSALGIGLEICDKMADILDAIGINI